MNRPPILAVALLLSSCAGADAGDDAGTGAGTLGSLGGGSSGAGTCLRGQQSRRPGTRPRTRRRSCRRRCRRRWRAGRRSRPRSGCATPGTATWAGTYGYKLGAVDDSDPLFTGGVPLADGEIVAPGDFYTYDPLSGAVVHSQQLAAGEPFELSGGEALLIRGQLTD